MFSEKENRSVDRIETLIGEQCNIVGNLSGSGLLKIDGSIDGDILWQDDVIIGPFALYNGNLSCKNAVISGKVKGNITCEESLTIESSGKITGDIILRNLVVKEGGAMDGKCTMKSMKELPSKLDL